MVTAGERRDGRRTDTRERIEETALQLFTRDGFSRTSLQDIADELGITKAAIYYHYPSRDELISALVAPAIAAIDAFFAEAAATEPDRRAFLERFFDLNHEHRRIFVALIADPTGLGSVDARGWVLRLAAEAQARLAGDAPTPDARIRAVMAVNGVSRCATLLTDVPVDELRARTVDAAIELLKGAAPA